MLTVRGAFVSWLPRLGDSLSIDFSILSSSFSRHSLFYFFLYMNLLYADLIRESHKHESHTHEPHIHKSLIRMRLDAICDCMHVTTLHLRFVSASLPLLYCILSESLLHSTFAFDAAVSETYNFYVTAVCNNTYFHSLNHQPSFSVLRVADRHQPPQSLFWNQKRIKSLCRQVLDHWNLDHLQNHYFF